MAFCSRLLLAHSQIPVGRSGGGWFWRCPTARLVLVPTRLVPAAEEPIEEPGAEEPGAEHQEADETQPDHRFSCC